jgi:hypothetical protein
MNNHNNPNIEMNNNSDNPKDLYLDLHTICKNMDSHTQNAMDQLVNYFSQYQEIMFKVFTTSQNMSFEINQLKKNIFEQILITFHEESMQYILYIVDSIQKKYKLKYFLALADFLDLIYQNAFYDVFSVKFQELEIIDSNKIKEAHLIIFNLIVYVEHIKYCLYEQLENKVPNDNNVIKNTLSKRKSNCLLRINVCVNLLNNYPRISNKDFDYLNIIQKYDIFKKNPNFTDKFFKEIH